MKIKTYLVIVLLTILSVVPCTIFASESQIEQENYTIPSYFSNLNFLNTSDSTSVYVYTPNNTAVPCYTNVTTLTEDDINDIISDTTLYQNITIVGNYTSNYNCHSYAWHSRSTSNDKWMNDPIAYFTDGSYFESTGQVGDIVVYFNIYNEPIHSGVVIARQSGTQDNTFGVLNLLTIRSKWGKGYLIEHNGLNCPYVGEGFSSFVTSYVKYYSHTHRYSSTIPYSSSFHRSYCTYSVCSHYNDEGHTFVQVGLKQRCSVCGYIYGGSTIQPWNLREVA